MGTGFFITAYLTSTPENNSGVSRYARKFLTSSEVMVMYM
jgi:hypothetical protein